MTNGTCRSAGERPGRTNDPLRRIRAPDAPLGTWLCVAATRGPKLPSKRFVVARDRKICLLRHVLRSRRLGNRAIKTTLRPTAHLSETQPRLHRHAVGPPNSVSVCGILTHAAQYSAGARQNGDLLLRSNVPATSRTQAPNSRIGREVLNSASENRKIPTCGGTHGEQAQPVAGRVVPLAVIRVPSATLQAHRPGSRGTSDYSCRERTRWFVGARRYV